MTVSETGSSGDSSDLTISGKIGSDDGVGAEGTGGGVTARGTWAGETCGVGTVVGSLVRDRVGRVRSG